VAFLFIYLLFKLNSKNLFDREGDLYKAYGFEPARDLLEAAEYEIGCLIKGLRVILRVSARCLCQNIILWHIAFFLPPFPIILAQTPPHRGGV